VRLTPFLPISLVYCDFKITNLSTIELNPLRSVSVSAVAILRTTRSTVTLIRIAQVALSLSLDGMNFRTSGLAACRASWREQRYVEVEMVRCSIFPTVSDSDAGQEISFY
jgi:hypothetical protein